MREKAVKHAVMCIVMLVTVAGVSAQDEPALGFDFGADYVGKYVWRGQKLADQSFQPYAGFSYGSLSGSVWASIDASNVNGNSGEATEVDYSLDWTDVLPGVESLSYSAGIINYTFPNTTTNSTLELYVGLSADVLLSPSITAYFDVDEAEGTYLSFGVGHSFESIAVISGDIPVGLDLGASLGWGDGDYNDFYWAAGTGSGLNDLVVSASLPMEFKSWTISPGVTYAVLLESDVKSNNGYSSDNEFVYAGIGASISF
jgi:hypothetical protein